MKGCGRGEVAHPSFGRSGVVSLGGALLSFKSQPWLPPTSFSQGSFARDLSRTAAVCLPNALRSYPI